MRKNERERLARRAEYLKSRPRPHKFIGETKDGRPLTQAHADEFECDQNIARHEAGHAVGRWIMGHKIDYMQFNAENDKGNHGDILAASTVGGERLPDIMALPIGERTVIGLQEAFVTLAGVVGGGDASSDNPLCKWETQNHLRQAHGKLYHIAGMDDDECRAQVARLLGVVAACFRHPVLQNMVTILAITLVKARRLEGNAIVKILNDAYAHGGSTP